MGEQPMSAEEWARLTRCIQSVKPRGGERQCSRLRGYGKNHLYCKQHAKRYAADRLAEKEDGCR